MFRVVQEYIYCVINHYNSEYIRFKINKCKRKAFRKKITLFLIILSIIIYILSRYFINIVNPIILSYGEQNVLKITTQSCNDAISQISKGVLYDDLISIGYNPDGSISYIKSKTDNINKISNLLAQSTQTNLDSYSKLGYKIPVGTLSGIGILTGRGSQITFFINPIGSVLCKFSTSFTSAGINQTLHKILVTIETDVSLVLPFQTKKIKKSSDFLLSECIIIGKIPSTYFNISQLENLV